MASTGRRAGVVGAVVVAGLFGLGLAWIGPWGGERGRVSPTLAGEATAVGAGEPATLAPVVPGSGGAASETRTVAEPAAAGRQPIAPTESGDAAGSAYLQVLAADGRTPRAGFELTVLLLGNRAAEETVEGPAHALLWTAQLTTDAEGRATLDRLGQHPDCTLVRLFPTSDWREELDPGELVRELLSGDPTWPTELFTRARLVAPIRGLAVDASTGRPLPQLALRLQRWLDLDDPEVPIESAFARGFVVEFHALAPLDTEWVVTDDQGRFATREAYPGGRYGFLTIDQERADLQHVVAADGTSPRGRLEVPVGPLVLLSFTPGSGREVTDYTAGLWRDPEELLRTEGLREHPSPWSADGGRRAGVWGRSVPVHAGSPPWTRLPFLDHEEPLPSRLFLVSRDGGSFGHVLVQSLEPYREQPLPVPVSEVASLAVDVLWPAGADSNLAVRLEDAQGTLHERNPERMHDEPRTSFVFSKIAPGPARLTAEGPRYEPWETTLQIPTAATIELRLEAREVPMGLTAGGRIVTASGQALDGQDGRAELVGLILFPKDRELARFSIADLRWSGGSAQFEFENLAEASYQLIPRWSRGGYVLEPAPLELTFPGPIPLLRVNDGEPPVWLEAHVPTEVEEGRVEVHAELRGSGSSTQVFEWKVMDALEPAATSRSFRAGPFARDAQLDVELTASGYTRLGLDDDHIPAADAKGRRVLRLEPEAGWNAQLVAYRVQEDGQTVRAAAADVVFALDDVAQPPTDHNGEVTVAAERKPERLAVVTAGWRLVTRTSWQDWGSVFAETGTFTVEDGRVDVFLIREP